MFSGHPGFGFGLDQCRLGPVEFRNLVIKDLSAVAPATPAFSATVQTDANQPRIEVVKEQGPDATEWALTPLEEAIPGDIRQNLTYLREDLLDENKKSPKAAAAAYTLASDYCDKILSALDQRDLARVNAGFSAAQQDETADADNDGNANLVEMTLPTDSPYVGKP